MDRAGKFLADLARLGIDERLAKLSEAQARLVNEVVRGVMADLNLSAELREAARPTIARRLHLAAAGGAPACAAGADGGEGGLMALLVGGQQVDRPLHVVGARPGVEPRGLQRGMAHQLGHGHQVDALTGELGPERVTEHVAGHVVVQACRPGDGSDHVGYRIGREPGTAAGGKQGGRVCARLGGTLGRPGSQGLAELRVNRHGAGLLSLADKVQPPLRAERRTSARSRAAISAMRVPPYSGSRAIARSRADGHASTARR